MKSKDFFLFTIAPGQTANAVTGTFSVPNLTTNPGWQAGRYSPTGWKLVVMIGGGYQEKESGKRCQDRS